MRLCILCLLLKEGISLSQKVNFTYTDSENHQVVGIDVGTVSKSKKALKRAQVLCLVVSAELGVEAQTRDCITMAVKHGVSSVVVFVSKVDVLDDPEQDAAVATIVDSIAEELAQHEFLI